MFLPFPVDECDVRLFSFQSTGNCTDCHDLTKMIDNGLATTFACSFPVTMHSTRYHGFLHLQLVHMISNFLYCGNCSLPQTLLDRPDGPSCKSCQGKLSQNPDIYYLSHVACYYSPDSFSNGPTLSFTFLLLQM